MERGTVLRGLTVVRCGNVRNLARRVAWSYAKTNRIVNGTQEARASEIRDLARALELESEEILRVFELN